MIVAMRRIDIAAGPWIIALGLALGCGDEGEASPCTEDEECTRAGEVCVEGTCRPMAREPDGGARADAGMRSDAGMDADAGMDSGMDAGPACRPSDCDDGIPCTVDRCGAGGCEHVADDARCDDGNACTDDVCDPTAGCVHPAREGACDDGVYCNGADSCRDGECAAHAGDPCGADTVCDETMAACVGCLEDDDCPADEIGDWTACGGFDGVCGTAGSQERSITEYACVSNMCVETVRVETQSCGRVTAGDPCASGCGSCVSGACEIGSASGWELLGTTLSASSGASDAYFPALALDGCAPVVAWSEDAPGGVSRAAHVRRWTGSAWETLGSPPGENALSPDLKVSDWGEIFVTYRQGESVVSHRWDGASWAQIGSSYGGQGPASAADLAAIAPSNLVTAFYRVRSCGLGCLQPAVRVFRWNGMLWRQLGGNFGQAANPALENLPGGAPVLAYGSDIFSPPGPVRLRRWAAGSWGPFAGGNVPGSSGARSIELLLDENEQPAVSWRGDQSLYVARRDPSGAWTTLASGFTVSASGVVLHPVAMALDGDDRLLVAWPERVDGTSEVYVRRQSGDTLVPLGSGLLDEASGSGRAPAAVVDPAGRPVVAWVEGEPAALRVARYTDP
jgi:hypothetical protein